MFAVTPLSRGRLIAALLVAVAFVTAASTLVRVVRDPHWRPRIWMGARPSTRSAPKWARLAG